MLPLTWLEWRERAVRGSLQETRATGPLRSRSLRSRQWILAQELRAAPPLYLGLHPGNEARGASDATRHRVPSPRGLRHLAPLTAPAPRRTETSAPHHPPTPEFPNQGRQEASQRSSIPTPSAPRGRHCSAALGSVGGILRSGSGRSARHRGGSGRGACAPASRVPFSLPGSRRWGTEPNPQSQTQAASVLPGLIPGPPGRQPRQPLAITPIRIPLRARPAWRHPV